MPDLAYLPLHRLGHRRPIGKRLVGSLARDEGGDQPGPVLEHQGDRLVVEVRAVVDGADSCPDGTLGSLGSVAVRHHEATSGRGLPNEHLELVHLQVGVGRIVGIGEEPTGGGDLDHVGAVTDQLANLFPHLLGAIDHAAGHSRVWREDREASPAGHPVVPVPSRLAEHGQRYLHARTLDQALLDGALDPKVCPRGVANGRDPEPQGDLQIPGRFDEQV